MKLLGEFFANYWKELIAVLSATLSAIGVGYAILKGHAVKRAVKEAQKRKTYSICPHCKQAIDLAEMDFFLPGGHKDNNLNGIPDDQEKGV